MRNNPWHIQAPRSHQERAIRGTLDHRPDLPANPPLHTLDDGEATTGNSYDPAIRIIHPLAGHPHHDQEPRTSAIERPLLRVGPPPGMIWRKPCALVDMTILDDIRADQFRLVPLLPREHRTIRIEDGIQLTCQHLTRSERIAD